MMAAILDLKIIVTANIIIIVLPKLVTKYFFNRSVVSGCPLLSLFKKSEMDENSTHFCITKATDLQWAAKMPHIKTNMCAENSTKFSRSENISTLRVQNFYSFCIIYPKSTKHEFCIRMAVFLLEMCDEVERNVLSALSRQKIRRIFLFCGRLSMTL